MSRRSFEANRATTVERDKRYTVKEYTPESCVKTLLALMPIDKNDYVLDAGSGINKVWFKNIDTTRKDEVEIDEGKDFYNFTDKVDWVVGNPPFTELVGFIKHSAEISQKGFAFLTNHARINQITPKRLGDLEEKGFYLSRIHIMSIKAWFGRYYFLVFTKNKNDGIGYSRENFA